MKTVGIIAEYNPFHNGHLYHIQKAKELTQADYAIVIMSGNFVQRGAPSIIDKFSRTRMALENGADIVIELPVIYATGSAEAFAFGAVAILEHLNCIDYLCFGSECGDIEILQEISSILNNEPEEYLISLKEHLKNGISFPLAREKAVQTYYSTQTNSLLRTNTEKLNFVLSNPNNILGIEYCKALMKLSSSITPITITRSDAGYHSNTLGNQFSSATSIRKHILDNKDWESLASQLPNSVLSILNLDFNRTYPVISNDFSGLLLYKLHMEKESDIEHFFDVSPTLAKRISNLVSKYESFDQFCMLLKSKELTYTRISRALLHILLNLKTSSYYSFTNAGGAFYARILGINKSASPLISTINKESNIPIIMKLSSQMNTLSDPGKEMILQDVFASQVYQGIISRKYKTQPYSEYKTELVFIDRY